MRCIVFLSLNKSELFDCIACTTLFDLNAKRCSLFTHPLFSCVCGYQIVQLRVTCNIATEEKGRPKSTNTLSAFRCIWENKELISNLSVLSHFPTKTASASVQLFGGYPCLN